MDCLLSRRNHDWRRCSTSPLSDRRCLGFRRRFFFGGCERGLGPEWRPNDRTSRRALESRNANHAPCRAIVVPPAPIDLQRTHLERLGPGCGVPVSRALSLVSGTPARPRRVPGGAGPSRRGRSGPSRWPGRVPEDTRTASPSGDARVGPSAGFPRALVAVSLRGGPAVRSGGPTGGWAWEAAWTWWSALASVAPFRAPGTRRSLSAACPSAWNASTPAPCPPDSTGATRGGLVGRGLEGLTGACSAPLEPHPRPRA